MDTAVMNNETESITDNPTDEAVLPIIVPSFDESSSRVILTSELSTTTTTSEEEQQPQETTDSASTQPEAQTPSTNNEYINPRGIRFTTAPATPATGGPVKGKGARMTALLLLSFLSLHASI
jgi:hypothetical protein